MHLVVYVFHRAGLGGVVFSDIMLLMQIPGWNGLPLFLSYLLGLVRTGGSLFVRVMVGSCQSGLKQSSCQSKQGQSFALHHQRCSLVNGRSSRSAGRIWVLPHSLVGAWGRGQVSSGQSPVGFCLLYI